MKANGSTIAIAFLNPVDRRLIADYLSGMGYKVMILSDEPIPQADLFLLDVPSAHRFGAEIIKLKEREEVFLPVMITLGRRDPADPYLAAGYDDVLRMPLSRAKLKANIGILLRLRRQTLELKKRGEEKYQAIFEATGTATLLLDEDTTILMANQRCLPLTGYRPEELIGTPWSRYADPDSLEQMLQYFKARQKDPSKAPKQYEAKLINKKGQVLHALIAVEMMPGSKKSVVSIMDITPQKEAEAALRESEERYKRLSRVAHEGIKFVVDFVIRDVNQRLVEMTGYSREELIGSPVTKIIHPDDQQLVIENIRSGYAKPYEFRLQRKDGSILYVEVHGETMEYEGQIARVAGIFDITERRKLQQALLKTKERLQHLLTVSPAIVFTLNPDTFEATWVSPNITEKLGYTVEETLRPTWWAEHVHPQDRKKAIGTLAEILSRGHLVYEYRLRKKDGSYLWVRDELRLLRDAEGNPMEIIGAWADITERKRMEMLQTAQYNIARAMIDETELASLFKIIRKELSTFLDTKNFILALYDEKSGMFHASIARDEKDTIPPSWPAKKSLIGQVIKKKKPLLLYRKDIEQLAQKGTIDIIGTIPEVWLGIPLFSEEQIVGALVIQNDENRHAYDKQTVEILQVIAQGLSSFISLKQVQAIQERLSAAIEQAAESVIITDPQGKIEYVNPAFQRVTGYSESEVLGKTPAILKSGRHEARFYQELWETISSGKTWQGKFINRRKDGSLFIEETSISPIFDARGNITHYVADGRDVTREEALEQERLRQGQKMEVVGRLASGVAHDFNNMISVILGYGDIILRQLNQDDSMAGKVKQIVKAGKRSAALTSQLLAFSRKQTLQPKVLDLNDLIRNLQKMLARLIGEDIELTFELAEDLSRIKVDPGQMEQVIMNLAVNARDAMPGGGKLTIETANVQLDEDYVQQHVGAKPGKYVRLSISDTGHGMDKETASKIFERFFTTKEKGKGTGLGLATVYGIIKQSGGHIWVYSEPGKGTTFKIYLPQIEAEAAEEKEKEAAITKGAGEQILVVEDEEALRQLVGELLKRLGYRVSLASNGGEALLLLEKKVVKPDLLITDVVMPNMSGEELVGALREKHPDLKVLYMSGYTDTAIVHHGVLEEGVHFLQKPFTIKDLSEKVQQVLRDRSKE